MALPQPGPIITSRAHLACGGRLCCRGRKSPVRRSLPTIAKPGQGPLTANTLRPTSKAMFGELYHNRVLELASDIPHVGRLSHAEGSSLKVSRVCGSSVNVDVALDTAGNIAAIAVDPKACALGQAATSILARRAQGKSLGEIIAAREALRAMLKE